MVHYLNPSMLMLTSTLFVIRTQRAFALSYNLVTGFLLLFVLGLAAPGWAQTCISTDPFGKVNPTGDLFSPSVATYCIGSPIGVAFSDFSPACPALGSYNIGNQYVLELSDASGSFTTTTTTLITSSFPGGVTGTMATGSFAGVVPSGIMPGSDYKVRLRSTNPIRYGTIFATSLTILASPVQPDFGASQTVAQNGTMTLTNTAACSGTLVWGRTNGDMATGTGSITVPTAQAGIVSYTATCRTACGDGPTGAISLTVTAVPPPTNVSLTSGTLTCAQTSLTLTGSATNAVSYTLSRSPGSNTANTTGLFPVSIPGTYTLTAANSSGVTASTTATVASNTTAPMPITLLVSGTLTCARTSVTLTTFPGDPTLLYAYSGPGLNQTNGPANTAVVSQSGVFSVMITAPNGCTSVWPYFHVKQDITAPATPTLTASNNSTLTCSVRTLTLTATPVGSVGYAFSGPGLAQTGTVNTAIVNQAGTYTLVTTNAAGCTASATTQVVSNTTLPAPAGLAATNGSILTCSVATLTLTATPTPASSFTYAFGAGATQIGATNQATVNASGTYSVTVTGTNGCTAITTTTVLSNTTAPAPVGLSASNSAGVASNTLTCSAPILTLTATPTGSFTYAFSSGASPIGTTNQATVNAPDTYSVLITGANGCTATATTTVISNTTAPVATIVSNPNATLTCTQTALTLTAGGGTSYSFSGPGIQSQNSVAGTASINAPGTYSIVVTNAVSGCSSTATLAITQTNAGLVTVGLMASTTTLSDFTPTALLTATAGAGTYRFLGPGLNQTGTSNQATVDQAGVYSVTAGVGACATTASISITGVGGVAPTPFVIVSGALSCASPTVSITATGAYQYGFVGLNGTGDGLVSQEDGWERTTISGGGAGDYALIRIPFPATGRAVVNKPGIYTVIARGQNGRSTQVQVVVTGVACP